MLRCIWSADRKASTRYLTDCPNQIILFWAKWRSKVVDISLGMSIHLFGRAGLKETARNGLGSDLVGVP